jgi:LexA-binding, inner membrane-associated putative hydrolase
LRSLPHITIACGAIWAGSRLLRAYARTPNDDLRETDGLNDAGGSVPDAEDHIDYRLVAIGSLLPDIIDRVQRKVFRIQRSSPHQHFIGHTLLFHLPLLAAGNYLLRRQGDGRLLSVSTAAMTHLLVDPVIRSPATLLWPLFGFQFPEARGLSPGLTAATQIVAAAAVLATLVALQRQDRLQSFVSSGRL